MPVRTYYHVLGVSREATLEEITNAKNALAKVYHPDANMHNDIDTTAYMQEILEAYRKNAGNTIWNSAVEKNGFFVLLRSEILSAKKRKLRKKNLIPLSLIGMQHANSMRSSIKAAIWKNRHPDAPACR